MTSTSDMEERLEPDNESWFVYMILTNRNALYTGITTNVDRRFQQHLDMYYGVPGSRGAKFFRVHKPLSIPYQKYFSNRSEASRYEYYVKRLTRKQKLALACEASGCFGERSILGEKT